MESESLTLHNGGVGLQALLARATGLDASATVRLRQYDATTLRFLSRPPSTSS